MNLSMNFSLLTILLTPFFGGLLSYAGSALHRYVRNVFYIIFLALPFLEIYPYFNNSVDLMPYANVFGYSLFLGINALSSTLLLLFTLMFFLAGIFLLFEFENNEDSDLAVLEFMFLEGSVFGVLLAKDILTFFIFFELIAVFTYFLIQKGYSGSSKASVKYISWALIGANFLLAAIILLFTKVQNFGYAEIAAYLGSASPTFVILVFAFFLIGILIEATIMPFHVWAPSAYSEAPDSVSVILSTVVKKAAIYILVVLVFSLFGLNLFLKIMPTVFNNSLVMYILQWMSALTIIIGTFIAIREEDAKSLLAWSSIAQAGYIVLGISLGTSLGVSGGLLHLINHSIFKGILFFVVGGVIYRTGTKKLAELGGLIKKMPVSFISMLIAIIALAGIPPLNGFVSKYLIYEALIQNKEPILLTIALLGGTGSFLYVYRLIHSIFLGQLSDKYADVKEVPLLMQVPMLVLSVLAILFGIFPSIPMNFVSKAVSYLGLEPIKYYLTGFPTQPGLHEVNILKISSALVIGFVVSFLIFILLPKAKRVDQLDNYYAGEKLTKETKYNYSFGFYSFFDDVLGSFSHMSVEKIYSSIEGFFKTVGDYLRKFYTGNLETYLSYGVVAIVIFALIYVLGGVLW